MMNTTSSSIASSANAVFSNGEPFSRSAQRVWLVDTRPSGSDKVQRTYPVSGSVTHNLQPGTYSVYSKSRWAVAMPVRLPLATVMPW